MYKDPRDTVSAVISELQGVAGCLEALAISPHETPSLSLTVLSGALLKAVSELFELQKRITGGEYNA